MGLCADDCNSVRRKLRSKIELIAKSRYSGCMFSALASGYGGSLRFVVLYVLRLFLRVFMCCWYVFVRGCMKEEKLTAIQPRGDCGNAKTSTICLTFQYTTTTHNITIKRIRSDIYRSQ